MVQTTSSVDGATVIGEIRDWRQALIGIGKDIPYIHCYNHQLHLAVVHAMQAEPCAIRITILFCFHRHYVSQNYGPQGPLP